MIFDEETTCNLLEQLTQIQSSVDVSRVEKRLARILSEVIDMNHQLEKKVDRNFQMLKSGRDQ